MLIDNDAIFYENSAFEIKCITKNIGCIDGASIAYAYDNVIWQGENGHIFCLNKKQNKINLISNNINSYIDTLKDYEKRSAKATFNGQHYMIFHNNKAIVIDMQNINNPACYIWEFPEDLRIAGIIANNNQFTPLCVNWFDCICFAGKFSGEKDIILLKENMVVCEKEFNIKGILKTKDFKIGKQGQLKGVTRAYLELKVNGNSKITINGDGKICNFPLQTADFATNQKDCVKLITNTLSTKSISFSIESEFPFEFGKSEIYYKELNN